ncbi:AsmA-like C-terminal region [Flavobacterium fluvii]|uniref:AsmA-like C-terminal region n=1 Tax=Flavobacterium fluvii TaxID=468056 RepID=A0A1M5ECX5_9FLAO|nr:AsmA family protein [Flavobacterium fluvii]SHF77047.1 AsmA-like C-terminal region [Flavobacterium fluvii]
MGNYFESAKSFFATKGFKRTFKIVGFFFLGLFALILVGAIGLRIYFERNKTEIVSKINAQINENILGEAKIGDIGYKFLIGFPNFTVVLKDVELKDSLIAVHKRPVLKAGEIEVRLNVLKLLRKEVSIHKIVINDATIDLFKDINGVSNSNIFKPKKNKPKKESNTTTSIDEVVLKNVNFISENQKGRKLFSFQIESLKTKIEYTDQGWKTDVRIKTFAKSLAFNTKHGSFVKEKAIVGKLAVDFSNAQEKISVVTEDLEIGDDLFDITAHFNIGKGNSLFDIDIRTKIKWSNAYNLLSNNISSKLNKFDLGKQLQVSCVIKGDMSVAGDPEIVVNAVIKDDQLKTSYGEVENCSFNGKFTNNYVKGPGCNDANSAVIITNFKGDFREIPISIPSAIINNLEKPVATGKFNSEYEVVKLNNTISEDLMKFSEGTAKVNLDFKVDIVNLKLNKPHFTGNIDIKNASFYFKPKNINFQKTDIVLHFTEKALLIEKIKYQNKVNTVLMEGKVDNFLNLYYDAPEKMTVNWKIYSPYLDIRQTVAVLSYHDKSAPEKTKSKNHSSGQLQQVFSKSKVTLDLLVDKMAFNKMVGNKFKVNILLSNSGLYVRNGSMQGSTGSSISFDAQLVPKNELALFKSNIKVSDGEISRFLASFNNFGVKSFKPNDIKGKLSFNASLSGVLNAKRDLVKSSLAGNFNFQIKNGALVNFGPIQKIGKVAFSNRDVSNIAFSDLYGITTVKGDVITVKEFKITSNVLNLDAKGTYSLSHTGTNLGVRIPLRNPKDDYKITDAKAREAARYKGIVVNLLVVDGKNGETKIKLGKVSEEASQEKQTTKKK